MSVKSNFIFTGGKITMPLVFPDGTIQSTAGGGGGGGSYLPLTGGTLTGNVTANNAQFIASDGIVSEFGETQERVFINYDSITLNNINGDYNSTIIGRGGMSMHDDNSGWNASYNANGFNINGQLIFGEESGLVVSPTGITFPDETTQTTAAVDLSQGGSIYGNLDFKFPNSETTYFQFNSEDGVLYIGGGLGVLDGGGFSFDWGTPYYWSFYDGVITFPDSSTQTTAGIPEAPQDGNAYVRKNGAWVDITTL